MILKSDFSFQTKWPKFPHSGLYCRLAHYNRPRLIIRPAKEEIVFRKPKIVIYHDILTDVETERLIKMAEPRVSVGRGFANAIIWSPFINAWYGEKR